MGWYWAGSFLLLQYSMITTSRAQKDTMYLECVGVQVHACSQCMQYVTHLCTYLCILRACVRVWIKVYIKKLDNLAPNINLLPKSHDIV